MANIGQASREIMYTIGRYLKNRMPSLSAVYAGWPESNVELQMPSMTIFTPTVGYKPEMNPYEYLGTAKNGAVYEYLIVHGEYNTNLQLDIWCRNKEERYRLISELQTAFLDNWPDLSLLLNMENYYDILCRYDLVDYNFDSDDELASQTKEWRVKIDLLAHCKAVHSREEFAILQTEIDDSQINEIVLIE